MRQAATRPLDSKRKRRPPARLRISLALAFAATLAVASPARADRVICDGNWLCLGVAIPVVIVGTAVLALIPDPPEKNAAGDIAAGNNEHLQFILDAHPALVSDPTKSQALLLAAATAGNLEASKILLDAGVPANFRKSLALQYASTAAEAELLMSRGASADEVDLRGMTVHFRSPAAAGLLAAVLDRRSALGRNDPDALWLLSSAAGANALAVTTLLLQRGVNPNGSPERPALIALASECNETPIRCETAVLPTARELIAKGADVNFATPKSCRTPLQAATERSNQALVALLESSGASKGALPEARCRRGSDLAKTQSDAEAPSTPVGLPEPCSGWRSGTEHGGQAHPPCCLRTHYE